MSESSGIDYAWPSCTICARGLWRDEIGRQTCRLCQARVDEDLAALGGTSGLYRQLATALTPTVGGGEARVSGGGRSAPLPVRLEPLSLSARGGVVTVLQDWLVDWHERLGWARPRAGGGLAEQCDQVVAALRANLEWAATEHPAVGDFAGEVGQLVRSCRRQVMGEREERRVAVGCPCGATLRVTISTPGARCSGCGVQYGRAEVLGLPLSIRSSVA